MRQTLTPSDKTADRLSAIEALRLLSMFMVLVLHADYAALGIPSAADLVSSLPSTAARVFFEQLSVVAVNVFVLISGWFGIRTSVRSVAGLLFQVIFYAVAVIAVACLTFGIDSSQTAWLTLVPGYNHWFIRSYLGLMILAPVLNVFIKEASDKQLKIITFAFLIFEFLYGWVIGADGFKDGYSLLSFIGLYLLAATARRSRWESPGPPLWGFVYTLCVIFSTSLSLIFLNLGESIPGALTAYDSPLVIGAALALMLSFAGNNTWRSKTINHLALSCLAVYLLHFNPLLFNRYLSFCRHIYYGYDSLLCIIFMALFLSGVFVASVLADQIRIWVWNKVLKVGSANKNL